MILLRRFIPPAHARSIRYVIREIVLEAEKYESKTGKKSIRLNIGDPCKFDFSPPQHAIDAYINALKTRKHFYGDSRGELELRKAIVEYEKRKNGLSLDVNDVLVTQGAAEAVNTILAVAFERGEEILIPSPTYPPYLSAAKFFGVKPIEYRCIEKDGWKPDIDHMRKLISQKTKAVIIINPNNPTGAVYDQKTIKEIVDFAGENDLLVISDEIYDFIVYDGIKKSINVASIAKDVPVITLYSLSKVYLATGWRIGYMYKHDPNNQINELWDAMLRFLMVRLSVNTPAQYAAVAALLGPQDHIRELVNKLQKRRDFIYKRLNEIEGISTQKPKGAFYIFPKIEVESMSDEEFCKKLLWETGLVVPPGSGFGVYGAQHFRIVFLPPVNVLEDAMDRLEKFMRKIVK